MSTRRLRGPAAAARRKAQLPAHTEPAENQVLCADGIGDAPDIVSDLIRVVWMRDLPGVAMSAEVHGDDLKRVEIKLFNHFVEDVPDPPSDA